MTGGLWKKTKTYFSALPDGTDIANGSNIGSDVVILSATEDLEVIDSIEGARMDETFLLIPRAYVVKHYESIKDFKKFVSSIEEFTVAEKNSYARGAKKEVRSDGDLKCVYSTVGTYASRNSRGLKYQSRNIDDFPDAKAAISTLVKKLEHISMGYITTELLVGILNINKMSGHGLLKLDGDKTTTIWPSIALSVNSYLNIHTDDDYFLSLCLNLTEEQPILESEILNYFCFPTKGVSVAIRNGDILLFNPLVEHCISSRVCKKKNVLGTTMYLKSAVVGGNDNSISISDLTKLFSTNN